MLSKPVRILIVEDDEAFARATLRCLRKHASSEIATVTAATLAQGLHELDEEPFDAVLLDLNLPDSVGVATLARTVERAVGSPIIVLTGTYEPSLPEKVFALGAQEYLHKETALGAILWRTLHHTLERAQAQRKLRESEQRLRQLSHRFVEAQEAERRHFARWLHDEIGQALSALTLSLGRPEATEPGQLSPALADARAMIASLLGRVREVALELRPGMLDDLGLVHALLWYVERFTTQTGVAVELSHEGLDARLEQAIETAAYRIVQTALTNVACHANTDRATLRIWIDEGRLHLEIADDGRGFDVSNALRQPQALGLASMRERADLVGGTLDIDSKPGAGTRISVELPGRAAVQQGETP